VAEGLQMANAVLDLPDPLQSEPASRADATAAGGADDLLSEMVGDEIDRLLAEADAKPPPPPGAAVNAPNDPLSPKAFDTSPLDEKPEAEATADAMSSTTAQELDEILSSVNSLINEVDPSTDEPASETHDVNPTLDSSPAAIASPAADDLHAELPVQAADPGELEIESPVSPAVRHEDIRPPVAVAAETAAMIDQLAPRAPAAAEQAVDLKPQEDVVPPAEDPPQRQKPHRSVEVTEPAPSLPDNPPPVGLLVRVLQLINKPFESCPPAARDAIGKIGVATLLNAAGILLYVYWIHPRR